MAVGMDIPDTNRLDAALSGPGFRTDPYSVLREIRSTAPVFRSEVLKGWLVSRFGDVDASLRNVKTYSNAAKMAQYMELQSSENRARTQVLIDLMDGNSMSMQDPPNHTRLRRIAARAFLPSRVAQLRDVVEHRTQALVDRCRTSGPFDLMSEIADPLPRQVLTDFLGVDERDAVSFSGWVDAVADFLISPMADQAVVDKALSAFAEMSDYVRDQVDWRKAHPEMDDVIGILAAAQDSEGFSDDEILATCVQIVFAGSGTTTSLIGNAVLSLLRNPVQMSLLRDEPERAPAAIEETLRFEPPVLFVFRRALSASVVQGVAIPSGSTVIFGLASANRDPERFSDPDQFEIGRKIGHQMAFGVGPHLCAGERLARLQGDIALRTLMRLLPDLGLAGEPRWKPAFAIRELETLPVAC